MNMKMNPIFLLFCFILNFLSLSAQPLLVAVLMVKNESSVMQKTLQPLVDAGITDFLIYDTGSTDDTIEVTQNFFEKNNISNFVIKQEEWIDFASSRNRALALTEQYFPDATFMLMLDAEWVLCNGQKLLEFCKNHEHDGQMLYHICIKLPEFNFYHARLIRCRSEIHFIGRVHEVPNIPADGTCDQDIYFALNQTKYGQQKTEQRWKKDLELLLQDYVDNPSNARTMFYIAQTYYCLQDWDNAAKWYKQRVKMQADSEEQFLANLYLGYSYARAGHIQKMVLAYLHAYHMRPWRAEPLIRLAEYYFQQKQYALAMFFAKSSLAMPYPHEEKMPIEKTLYERVRYEIVAGCALYIGEFKLGKQVTQYLLTQNSESEFLQNLLNYYESMTSNGY